MKILCLIDSLNSGGAQRQMVNLAILLKKKGYAVTFVIYHRSSFYGPILQKEGIDPVLIMRKNRVLTLCALVKYLRNYEGDCVISFLDMPNFIASIASIGKKKWKLIISERSARESAFGGKKNRVLKNFSKYADYIVCNSENASKLWINFYPELKNKIRVIYNPVIIPDSIINHENMIEKRIDEEKTQILIAASYQNIKNPRGLIEAINLLDDDEKEKLKIDWYGRVEVVEGDRKEYDSACELIKKTGLENVVVLHGETRDIYQRMINSDAVALFSKIEGLPNAICEGMVLGKPILMSSVSDYSVLVDGNGFVCNPHDISSIEDCIRKFLSLSQKERRIMGQRSYELGEELFSINMIVKQWESLFNDEKTSSPK